MKFNKRRPFRLHPPHHGPPEGSLVAVPAGNGTRVLRNKAHAVRDVGFFLLVVQTQVCQAVAVCLFL